MARAETILSFGAIVVMRRWRCDEACIEREDQCRPLTPSNPVEAINA